MKSCERSFGDCLVLSLTLRIQSGRGFRQGNMYEPSDSFSALWSAGSGDALSTAESLVTISSDVFGKLDNQEVRRFTLQNKNQLSVQIITYGAIVTSLRVPDKNGQVQDIVLGFDSLQGYRDPSNPYFGATVGRVANRIANATFDIDGKTYTLPANEGSNTLHGGFRGLDKYVWEASPFSSPINGSAGVTLTVVSPDGDQGFPGTLMTQVTYELTNQNELRILMRAMTSKPTPVNIVNHSYFNLAGHCAGAEGVYRTVLAVHADAYTVTNKENIPTGLIAPVDLTPFDLRSPRLLGETIAATPEKGFDHNFVLNKKEVFDLEGFWFVARAVDPISGRTLNLYSDQSGVQLYTGNGLPENGTESDSKFPPGKGGVKYHKHGAFCLETQNFPDAIHHANFPNSVLHPGKIYKHAMVLRFGHV